MGDNSCMMFVNGECTVADVWWLMLNDNNDDANGGAGEVDSGDDDLWMADGGRCMIWLMMMADG